MTRAPAPDPLLPEYEPSLCEFLLISTVCAEGAYLHKALRESAHSLQMTDDYATDSISRCATHSTLR